MFGVAITTFSIAVTSAAHGPGPVSARFDQNVTDLRSDRERSI